MTDSRRIIASRSELLSFTNYLADALRASGASTLRPPWATCMLGESRRRVAPAVAYKHPNYVELEDADNFECELL
eukprot:8776187-Pyramimonas_sp.AAC.1